MTDKYALNRRVMAEIFGAEPDASTYVAYASDLTAAFSILEYLHTQGFQISITDTDEDEWELELVALDDADGEYRDLTVASKDLALIICEAALYCLGHEVDGY